MLRDQVGDSAFFRALRGYYATYKHSTALSDDLRAEMERTSNQKLGWFFDQWLRRPGYPVIDVASDYDARKRELTLSVKQLPRFGRYRFPLTVAVVDSAGVTHRQRFDIPATDAVVRARLSLPKGMMSIVVDPDVDLLYKAVPR
jgi:aminopeptidase N